MKLRLSNIVFSYGSFPAAPFERTHPMASPLRTEVAIKDLRLDLSNFRTVPQPDEVHAVQAMKAISPDYFWALVESLIDSGYLPTENIILLEAGGKRVVKEGNRRIAALKLIHGLLPSDSVEMPENIERRIKAIPPTWKAENTMVPCTIYQGEDAGVVDRIVTLAHGKAEKAGRDQWNAIARARHNRDVKGQNEHPLDLLEKYLKMGSNVSPANAERWAGDYPLSVLEELMKKAARRFGVDSGPALAQRYPSVSHRDILEAILHDIGLKVITFTTIREKNKDFAERYGLPLVPSASSRKKPGETQASGSPTGAGGEEGRAPAQAEGAGATSDASAGASEEAGTEPAATEAAGGTTPTEAKSGTARKKTAAAATNDPASVKRAMRNFVPRGKNREKVVTLLKEVNYLDLSQNPLAFCFLLRSMFEISAKAYCEDHRGEPGAPKCVKDDGTDRYLTDVLRDIGQYMMKEKATGKRDRAMEKMLTGPMSALLNPDTLLSVQSMNQLIHNPRFSVTASDISSAFWNIFPLLEAMNK